MFAQEIMVTCGGSVPAIIFHKGRISPQVHLHFFTTDGAMGHKLCRNFHTLLFLYHAADSFLIVICLLMAGSLALPKAVVSLGVEQPLLVKAVVLEKVVYVGGQDKVVLVLQQLQQTYAHLLDFR